MKGRGQACGLELQPVGNVQGERQVCELLGRAASETHQAGELAIGADEDVLAVVYPPVVVLMHHPRPPAQGMRTLEHGDMHAGAREFDGTGQAGVASTDDGDDGDAHALSP